VAEKGLAAHWRYKGLKGESGLDEWLNNIRSALETGDDMQLMDQFKMDLYEDEVYIFSPKGQIFKFPKGATVLDFAYYIHSDVGNHCTGGKINGKAVSFRQALRSGDTVEILTQNNQTPKRDWINIVQTSRAKSKVRLALKETQQKEGLLAREMLERRFKNRKIEMTEANMSHTIKRMGYKETSDFYKDLSTGKIDVNDVVDKYVEVQEHDETYQNAQPVVSAQEFNYENPDEQLAQENSDVLVIDRNLKGIDFSLAKCCHPIYGDDVFGFVTVNGGVKIHRCDCPNAPEMRRRFGYRIVRAKWSGKDSSQYGVTLRIVGNDDIGVVNNITSIIAKEDKVVMRSINIDSHDGLFSGNIMILLDDVSQLKNLMKKLRMVKGVKQINRI
jgi:GTP pyrophosphokinase